MKQFQKMLVYCFLSTTVLAFLFSIFVFATPPGYALRKFLTSAPPSQPSHPNQSVEPPKQNTPAPQPTVPSPTPPVANPPLIITITTIEKHFSNHFFKGKLMTISNPLNVHLVTTKNSKQGELLATIASSVHAIGAINASGFYDPKGMGDGDKPLGIMITDGKTTSPLDQPYTVAGLTDKGTLLVGSYTPSQLLANHVMNAAGFRPPLIINGQKMITSGNGGWGYDPRTAIGQTKDGTLLFLVIDGRQPNHSIGASLKDVQDLLYDAGAINAMTMDGGASAAMYFNQKIINIPATKYHLGRYIPNAWVVTPNPNQTVELYEDGKKVSLQ